MHKKYCFHLLFTSVAHVTHPLKIEISVIKWQYFSSLQQKFLGYWSKGKVHTKWLQQQFAYL